MRRVAIAVLLALACGCRKPPPRVIRLQVAADEQFRRRPACEKLLAARFQEATALFRPYGVVWEVSSMQNWDADRWTALEDQRRRLTGHIEPNALAMGIITGPRGDALGAESPLDPRVVVVDFPAQPEAYNRQVLAHQLGHLLGAWHSPDPNSIMHVPPGRSIDKATARVIAITRSNDFHRGGEGLGPDKEAALNKFWSESRAPAGTHPLGLYYAARGREATARSGPGPAIEHFARAANYDPNCAAHHMLLGVAQATSTRYADAATSFERASRLEQASVPALHLYGATLANLKRWAEAAAVFRKALDLRPQDTGLRAKLGAALLNVPGQADEGEAELRKVLAQDPDNELAPRALEKAGKPAPRRIVPAGDEERP